MPTAKVELTRGPGGDSAKEETAVSSVNPGTRLKGRPPALSEFHEKCIGLLIILNETCI